MLLDEIAYHLDTNSTARTLGTNLFKGFEPPQAPDTSTFLHEWGGLGPALRMGSSTPAYERPRVQIVDRSTNYQTARTAADTWYRLLMGVANQTIKPSSGATGCRYLSIIPVSAPFDTGQDENGRHRVVCNFEVAKYLST